MKMTIHSQQLQTKDMEVQLELYDVPGNESFMVLNRMYLRDTNAALIVYDVTNPDSLRQAEKWYHELKEYAPSELVLSCCGTRLDAPGLHAVSQMDGQEFSKKHGIPVWYQVSSRTKEGVDNLFGAIAMQCYNMRDKFVSLRFSQIKIDFSSPQPTRVRNTFKLQTDRDLVQDGGKKKGCGC